MDHGALSASFAASHKYSVRCTIAGILIGWGGDMATYKLSEKRERSLVRCAVCDATVITEVACASWIDANTACASRGMTQVASPFDGNDYFDVIMRVGRPISRGAGPPPSVMHYMNEGRGWTRGPAPFPRKGSHV
jgi:hypothetical protein